MTGQTIIKHAQSWIWLAALLPVLPWLLLQKEIGINVDHAWLMTCAGRLLDGGAMLSDCYETNPPLSVILHFIPAFLQRGLDIPPYDAVFYFSLACTALSCGAVYIILKHWPEAGPVTRSLWMSVYIAANTVLTSLDFGERDHIAFLALYPFLLAQFSLSWGYKIPAGVKWPVLAVGAAAALIKPHLGLLPFAALVYRAGIRNSLNVWKDPDFIALAAASLLYLGICFVFFSDYMHEVFPDVYAYYLQEKFAGTFKEAAIYALFPAALSFLCYIFPLETPRQKIVSLHLWGSFIALYLFALQGKGLFYHLIPAFALFTLALFLYLFSRFAEAFNPEGAPWKKLVSWLCVTALLFGAGYKLLPLNYAYARHKDYADFEIVKTIRACGEDCTFFMFNNSMEITQHVAVYTGLEHGSRFGNYWWLYRLLLDLYRADRRQVPPEEAAAIKARHEKYARYVGEDFARYKPDIVAIGRFTFIDAPTPYNEPGYFDFVKFFSVNETFSKEWQNYEKTGEMTLNRADFFRGSALDYEYIITYDLYRRRP